MAEKATLLRDLPPVATDAETQQTATPAATPDAADSSAAAATETAARIVVPQDPPVTITGMEQAAYYSFFATMLVAGAAGFFFLAKAVKPGKALPRKGAGILGGVLLVLAGFFFLLSNLYNESLFLAEGQGELLTRGLFWLILAPLLIALTKKLPALNFSPADILNLPMIATGLGMLILAAGQAVAIPGLYRGIIGLVGLAALSYVMVAFLQLSAQADAASGAPAAKPASLLFKLLGLSFSVYALTISIAGFVGATSGLYLTLNILDVFIIGAVAFAFMKTLTAGSDPAVEFVRGSNPSGGTPTATPAPPKPASRPRSARSLMD